MIYNDFIKALRTAVETYERVIVSIYFVKRFGPEAFGHECEYILTAADITNKTTVFKNVLSDSLTKSARDYTIKEYRP